MKAVVALLLSVPPLALGADTSLSLCQAVTTYFFNTCTDTDGDGYVDAADSVAEMTGEVVIAVVNNCPGNGTWISDDECQWTRKLCVSCDASTGTTRIRVQTNNMPDGSGQMAPVGQAEIDEKNLDFEVNFNQAVVTGQNYETEATTQDEVDDALCSTRAMASAKINDDNDFESADGSDTTVGNGMVTITGIVSWGTSANDVDPWFPPAYWNGVAQEVESVDNCLVHAADGWLHHHSLSPAYWASDGSTCTAYQALAQYDDEVSVTTLMFEGEDGDSMDGHEDLQIVGIALDGHLVFGPYASSTVEVYDGTGLDMCNGVRYDDDADGTRDAYAYFMSKTFPYQMGCWGPANYPDHTPNCTTNAQSSYSTKPALFNALYGSSSTIGPKPTSQPTPAPSLEPTTETPAPTKDSGDPNVLIVQFDDALAAYFEDWGDYVNPPDFPDGYRYEAGDFDGLSDYLPNIDSVRKNGVSFTHAYTTSSSCAPTRFSVLTGRYPSRGVFNTARSASAYGSDVRTYVQVSWSKLDDFDSLYNAATIFSGQGYATAHIGKWHLTPGNEDGGSMEDDTYASQVSAVKARGFDYVDGLYTENINTCAGEDYCSTFTHNLDWMTTRAVEFMDEYSDVPFFLYFNPTVPHEPDLDDLLVDGLCADGESSCDRQDTVDGRLDSVPTVYGTLCLSEDCEMPSYSDLWDTAEDAATATRLESAVASAIWVDDSLGVMLSYLDEQGELENTIIVVTSDNGSEKTTLYETGVRAPLFVRWTRGGISKGAIVSELVSSIDILPTLVDFAFPDYSGYTDFDGVSWAKLATGAATSLSRDSIIVEYGFDRAVIRDDTYKLISTLDDSTCRLLDQSIRERL
ncbi:hypothetical protein CTAYLR_001570 [Chrysophaeum taylorii]|uniref:Sulfatase N-terminal domain-containing protein n=1 Tax=Chrysophaeum taylorii TaxID=2483200 RepID=A0AAD7UG10_9STRA|nr:hypothetical protein CTAYLR_001570 [Chrysophaeum taylorii]